MSTMIDRWNRIKVSAEGEAQSHSNELRASRCEGQAHAIKIAIDDFVDACTPRAPKPEWFGTGKGQWDSWWFAYEEGGAACTFHDVSFHVSSDGYDYLTFGKGANAHEVWLDAIVACVPVAREGFPSPRGWKGIAE